MKVLLSWLNDYADFGDDADAIGDALTAIGLAVDGIDHVGATVPGVITARVLSTEQHPDAAKVQRVRVDPGTGTELHIWCGAFNMAPGDIVPLATLGTAMPDGRVIERRPILGIDSEGMLCSARELGLGEDHGGILILPAATPVGLPYGEALGVKPDVLFDLDVTRNRPDCWGHVGVARDLAARMGLPMREPDDVLELSGPERSAPVELIAGDRCGRFTSTVLTGIVVGPSAPWMQRRLTAVGMRPINNVVDVSNYVMLDLNHPNHAYDLATLGGGSFRVRLANDGESITTLDGTQRALSTADLTICDANDVPIGVGGVMGDLHSEITAATETVALEVAWFDPVGTMQSAQRLGLRTEASARYERGIDPAGLETAAARFVRLLRETCPDVVAHTGRVDVAGPGLPAPRREATVRVARVNALLDLQLNETDIWELLQPIGFLVGEWHDGEATVLLPSWRPDATAEIDVIEEVARRYGYERIGKTVPDSAVFGGLSVRQQRRRQLRQVLAGIGATEAMPNPFLDPADLRLAGLEGEAIALSNPLVAEESVLRTSLRPGLLKAIAYNESHRSTGVTLYEIGHVYPPGDGPLPDEHEALCVVFAGREADASVAAWREIAAALGAGARLDQGIVPPGLHPGRSAALTIGRDRLGAVGEVHPSAAEAFGVGERVAVLELNLDLLLAKEPAPPQAKPVSRYPSSDIDLAFVLPDAIPAEKLEKAIRQGAGNLLADVSLFDVYRGKGVDDGARSLAYRLRLQAPDRTLTDTEVSAVRDKCIKVATALGAALRA
jgi:phenylalanyl-tRNA synthetase beta chain